MCQTCHERTALRKDFLLFHPTTESRRSQQHLARLILLLDSWPSFDLCIFILLVGHVDLLQDSCDFSTPGAKFESSHTHPCHCCGEHEHLETELGFWMLINVKGSKTKSGMPEWLERIERLEWVEWVGWIEWKEWMVVWVFVCIDWGFLSRVTSCDTALPGANLTPRGSVHSALTDPTAKRNRSIQSLPIWGWETLAM
jgi:hypothetical protein